jgi:hypothetical protein
MFFCHSRVGVAELFGNNAHRDAAHGERRAMSMPKNAFLLWLFRFRGSAWLEKQKSQKTISLFFGCRLKIIQSPASLLEQNIDICPLGRE